MALGIVYKSPKKDRHMYTNQPSTRYDYYEEGEGDKTFEASKGAATELDKADETLAGPV